MRVTALGLALAGMCGAAGTARAGESEWVVSPTVGYRVMQAEGAARHGGAVGLDVEYGLTDSWALRGAGHYAGHAFSLDGGYLQAGGLGFGALYTFDVLRVVPYASATVGASVIGGAGVPLRYNAEIRVGVGADYLVRRDFSVGLELRYTLQVPDFQRYPYAIGVAIRLSWRDQ
jgi:hypothetical protein